MSFRAPPRLVSGNQMMSTTLSGNSLHAAVCGINLSENKRLFFIFFLNSSSPSSCPFSLLSHPSSRSSSLPSFFCPLPFCCWSLAVFLPPAPSVFGFTFPCVWLYFPYRTNSYWFFLVLLAQELWMGWIWGVLGMEPRVSCTLSTSCTTKPHFQPQ